MSGGNQIVSCPMAIVVTTISLFPSYEHHNWYLTGAHTIIHMAYMSVKNIDEVIEIAEDIQTLTEGVCVLI